MPLTEPHREEGQQFLSFFFGGEEYAAEILRIREVVEYQRLTPVPTTPPWVRGVMNLRGKVVPVLDLAAKLQQGETPVEKLTCIVIFEVELAGEPTPMGVMIDVVGRVLELRAEEIQEPPDFGSPVRIDLLEGLGMVDDKPIPILDIQKVLTEEELVATVTSTEEAVAEEARSHEPEPERSKPPEERDEEKKKGKKRSAKKSSSGKKKASGEKKDSGDKKSAGKTRTREGSAEKMEKTGKASGKSKSKRSDASAGRDEGAGGGS